MKSCIGLALDNARIFVSSFDRPNIRYRIVEKDNARAQLLDFIRAEHRGTDETTDAGMIYCLSRRKVEETAEWLKEQGSARCLTTREWSTRSASVIRKCSSVKRAS